MSNQEAIKARLERGFEILESIRRRRIRRGSPSLGAAIEHAIIQRELIELEAEYQANPLTSIGNAPESE